MAAFRMSEEFYNHCQFNKDAFHEGFKLDWDECHLLVTVKYLELRFSCLDEDSKEEATPSKQENDVPISSSKVAFNEMAIAPSKATSSVADP